MDRGTNNFEFERTRSFSRTISTSSSLERRSLSLSGVVSSQIDDEIESEIISETGDIGDRALPSRRYSDINSLHLSTDIALENRMNFSIPENDVLQSNAVSTVTPLPLFCSEDQNQEKEKMLPKSLEYISCLIHLAIFGILGVLTRYLLQKLYGGSTVGVTSNESILYLDLPSNMVGSFLMGWFGVVFKGDISKVSDCLAIGLTTGYLGSLTTFSGWNQKMLELSVDGHWVSAFLGFLIGLFLATYSIIFGVETAKGFRWLLLRNKETSNFSSNWKVDNSNWKVDNSKCHFTTMLVMMLLLVTLWTISIVLAKNEFNNDSGKVDLWLGCIVGPFGVWIRWFLARLNGCGLGNAGTLKWLPIGTLIANVLAACMTATLATIKEVVNTKTCITVATSIQFGFFGCLSTVSTFIAEFNAMRESTQPWRAYAYAGITIIISFGLGILTYSVPVWIKGYK